MSVVLVSKRLCESEREPEARSAGADDRRHRRRRFWPLQVSAVDVQGIVAGPLPSEDEGTCGWRQYSALQRSASRIWMQPCRKQPKRRAKRRRSGHDSSADVASLAV
eukprot:s958_g19.t2